MKESLFSALSRRRRKGGRNKKEGKKSKWSKKRVCEILKESQAATEPKKKNLNLRRNYSIKCIQSISLIGKMKIVM